MHSSDRQQHRQQAAGFILGFFLFAAVVAVWPMLVRAATTLTGSAQTVVVMATSTINTVTFTVDGTTATGTTGFDLRIHVSSTINAVFDESVTEPTIGGTASAKVATTITYENSGRTAVVDITSNFATADTLTLAGLKLVGRTASSTVANLEFDTAGGYSTSTASYAVTVDPATLTSTNVENTSLAAGSSGTSTISFTLPSDVNLPADGKIQVIYPTGYDLSGVGGPDATCSTMNGTFSLATSTSVATITRAGGAAQIGTAESCTIKNVRTPGAGTTGTYQIKLLTAGNAVIAYDTAVTADTITAGTLGGVSMTFSSLFLPSSTGNMTLIFTPVGGIPTAGKIVFAMPSGFTTASVAGHCATTMDGTFTISGTGTVTITRAAGTIQEGSSETCTINNVVTPSVVGDTGTFTLSTTDSSDVTIDSATISGVTIALGGGGGGGSSGGTTGTTPTPTPTPTTSTPTPTTPAETTPAAPAEQPAAPAPTLPEGVAVYDLVRGSQPGVYIVASDGMRYVFPSEEVYRSWYADFTNVRRINDDTLSAMTLGGVIRMRPGTHLVKIVSDPKVYAVESGGALRWVETEAVARALYGDLWAMRIRDVDVSLFVSYTVGESIAAAAFPPGSVVRDANGDTWYISPTARRRVTTDGMGANHIQEMFVIPTTLALPDAGSDVTGMESSVAAPAP